MGERRQVSRGADRSLGRDDRIGLGVQEIEQRLDDLAPDARVAPRQGVDLEQEDQADDPVGQRRADAGAVRQHQAALQLGPRYDMRAFHTAVVGNGGMPLEVLEVAVQDYVDATP